MKKKEDNNLERSVWVEYFELDLSMNRILTVEWVNVTYKWQRVMNSLISFPFANIPRSIFIRIRCTSRFIVPGRLMDLLDK